VPRRRRVCSKVRQRRGERRGGGAGSVHLSIRRSVGPGMGPGVWRRVLNATCRSWLPEPDGDCSLAFPAPKVCDACKNKNEDDNDIVENLCKNDFGKWEQGPLGRNRRVEERVKLPAGSARDGRALSDLQMDPSDRWVVKRRILPRNKSSPFNSPFLFAVLKQCSFMWMLLANRLESKMKKKKKRIFHSDYCLGRSRAKLHLDV